MANLSSYDMSATPSTTTPQVSVLFDEYVEVLLTLDERWAPAGKYNLARCLRGLPEFENTTALVRALILEQRTVSKSSSRLWNRCRHMRTC